MNSALAQTTVIKTSREHTVLVQQMPAKPVRDFEPPFYRKDTIVYKKEGTLVASLNKDTLLSFLYYHCS